MSSRVEYGIHFSASIGSVTPVKRGGILVILTPRSRRFGNFAMASFDINTRFSSSDTSARPGTDLFLRPVTSLSPPLAVEPGSSSWPEFRLSL